MSRWFRHYAGMMRDDKLVSAAIKSKQTIERVVWVWGAILESASEIDDDGRYEIDTAEIAWFLRADQSELDAIEDALHTLGRVHQGRVARWGVRQFQSDRSAERQRRYRERNKVTDSSEAGEAQPVTEETSRNIEVTSQSRHGDAPETETETETDILEPNGSCASGDANQLKPEHVVESWNDLAPTIGKPMVRDLTPERRVRLKARIAGYSIDDFNNVLAGISRSSFLRGDTGWHGCTFDWFTKKANFQKILEGNYDN